MFLACRQKITFTSNLKLIISFLDHKYHSLLQYPCSLNLASYLNYACLLEVDLKA